MSLPSTKTPLTIRIFFAILEQSRVILSQARRACYIVICLNPAFTKMIDWTEKPKIPSMFAIRAERYNKFRGKNMMKENKVRDRRCQPTVDIIVEQQCCSHWCFFQNKVMFLLKIMLILWWTPIKQPTSPLRCHLPVPQEWPLIGGSTIPIYCQVESRMFKLVRSSWNYPNEFTVCLYRPCWC